MWIKGLKPEIMVKDLFPWFGGTSLPKKILSLSFIRSFHTSWKITVFHVFSRSFVCLFCVFLPAYGLLMFLVDFLESVLFHLPQYDSGFLIFISTFVY